MSMPFKVGDRVEVVWYVGGRRQVCPGTITDQYPASCYMLFRVVYDSATGSHYRYGAWRADRLRRPTLECRV